MADEMWTNVGRQMYGMASRTKPKIKSVRQFLHHHPEIGLAAVFTVFGVVGTTAIVKYKLAAYKEMNHVYKKEFRVIRPEDRKKEYCDDYYNLPN